MCTDQANMQELAFIIKSRSYFSPNFIVAAARLALEARRMEDEGAKQGSQYYLDNSSQHRGLVLSAIISSTCCLEAFINEFFSDMNEPSVEYPKAMPQPVSQTMAELWSLDVPKRATILAKYTLAYFLIKNARLDTSRPPAQDVGHLAALRNALVHFEPSWKDHGQVDIKAAPRSEQRFNSLQIPRNTFTGGQKPFYPDQLLGSGCAKWSVQTAVAFIDFFCKEIGIRPPYDSERDLLKC